jgi:hypothetical protein
LKEFRFIPNQNGRPNAILVDGLEYHYRTHRRSSYGTRQRVWYRCLERQRIKCMATACHAVKENILLSVSEAHTHPPLIFKNNARYIYIQCRLL